MSLTNRPKRNGACGVWENAVKERVQSKSSEHH